MKKEIALNLSSTENKVYQRMVAIAAHKYGVYRGTIKLADECNDDAARDCASMEYDMFTGMVEMIAKLFGFDTDQKLQVYSDVERVLKDTDWSELANDAVRGMITLA